MRKGFLYYKDHHDEVENLIPENYSYTFSGENMERMQAYEQEPVDGRESIYDVIDRKADELRQRGISEGDISTIINAELEYDMKRIASRLSQENVSRESLLKIVDRRIVTMVEKFLEELKITAMGTTSIGESWKEYDCVLVGPQVSYRLADLRKEVGIPVEGIPSLDYAVGNAENIMKLAHKITGI